MEKLQVWVDLKDRRYAKRLIEFLSLRYADSMQVAELIKEYQKPDLEGILLTDKEHRKESYDQILWVSADEGLNPYQSAHKIAREILIRKESWHLSEKTLSFAGQSGEWVSVYSPAGGVGKSTLAMGLADVLARKKKVLFLSLEGPSAWHLYFHYPLNYNLSDFFYCFLLGGQEEWKKQIKEMAYKQSNGVYFLSPCLYPDDLLEMRDIEVVGWMDLLKENFDYVVADLSSQMIRPLRIILQHSSKPCFLVDQKAEGRAKWQDFELLNDNFRDHWIFYRHADKSKQGEVCLPEDGDIFVIQDGIRRFSTGSMYYNCLEKAVEGWT